MVDALGRPDWATDPALATHAGRRAAHDLLDEKLGAWAAEIDLDKAVDLLVGAGVPAAPAYDARLSSQHPQFVARRYYEDLDHPIIGDAAAPVAAVPLRQRRPLAPHAGADARPAQPRDPHRPRPLREEIAALEADDQIGTTPLGL